MMNANSTEDINEEDKGGIDMLLSTINSDHDNSNNNNCDEDASFCLHYTVSSLDGRTVDNSDSERSMLSSFNAGSRGGGSSLGFDSSCQSMNFSLASQMSSLHSSLLTASTSLESSHHLYELREEDEEKETDDDHYLAEGKKKDIIFQEENDQTHQQQREMDKQHVPEVQDLKVEPQQQKQQQKHQKGKTRVGFRFVDIREYAVTVGELPLVLDSGGGGGDEFPLTLSWEHTETKRRNLTDYEKQRTCKMGQQQQSNSGVSVLSIDERRRRVAETQGITLSEVTAIEICMITKRVQDLMSNNESRRQVEERVDPCRTALPQTMTPVK